MGPPIHCTNRLTDQGGRLALRPDQPNGSDSPAAAPASEDAPAISAPGAATPPHQHGCDEVVLCESGLGELHIDSEVHRFGAGQTVVLPRGRVHQIFSVGPMPLEILGIFPQTPVEAFLPDGQPIELPWRS